MAVSGAVFALFAVIVMGGWVLLGGHESEDGWGEWLGFLAVSPIAGAFLGAFIGVPIAGGMVMVEILGADRHRRRGRLG